MAYSILDVELLDCLLLCKQLYCEEVLPPGISVGKFIEFLTVDVEDESMLIKVKNGKVEYVGNLEEG